MKFVEITLIPGFQHSIAVSVVVTVSVKTVSAPAVPYDVAGACRQASEFPAQK